MATKKQKRAAALAKHEADMKAYREGGLQALHKDREYRAHKEREEWRANHDKNHSWKKRIKECPLCNDEIRAAKQAAPVLGEFADAAVGAQKGKDDQMSRVEALAREGRLEEAGWERAQADSLAEFDKSIGGVTEMSLGGRDG